MFSSQDGGTLRVEVSPQSARLGTVPLALSSE